MAKRKQAQADQPAFPKNPLAANRPTRTQDPKQNARGYSRFEWAAAGYDPDRWAEALPQHDQAPASAIVADLIQQLRGEHGQAILARIKAHPRAPAKQKPNGPTAYQLAHTLQYAKESAWYDAAEAVARELAVEGELDPADVPPVMDLTDDDAERLRLTRAEEPSAEAHTARVEDTHRLCVGDLVALTYMGLETYGRIVSNEPGYEVEFSHAGQTICADRTAAELRLVESAASETTAPAADETALVRTSAPPIEHLARCGTCQFSIRFRPSSSGAGFTLLADSINLGIGPNGRPICREDAHGEMGLADEQLVPASEAIGQVAARVNGQPEQRKLPLPVTEPNWQAMLQQTTDLRREVRQRVARWKDVHDKAAQLKKLADEGQTRLSEWEDSCEERTKEWATYQEQLQEAQEAAERDAEPEVGETSDGKAIDAGAGSDAASEAVL